MHERVDLDAVRAPPPCSRAAARLRASTRDQAVPVDLEHESVGGVGDEPASPLLLVDLRLGACEREGGGRALAGERGLERCFGGRAPAQAHRAAPSRSINASPANAAPIGAIGEAEAGASESAPRPAAELGVSDCGAGRGPLLSTVGPSETRTSSPLGRPVVEARTSSPVTTAPATSPVRALRRWAAVRSGSPFAKTGTKA